MSNVPQNERKKLSVEEFQYYKKTLSMDNLMYVYSFKALLEETNLTVEMYREFSLKEFNIDTKEFEEMLNAFDEILKPFGIGLTDCSAEQILEQFPEELKSDLLQYKNESVSKYNLSGLSGLTLDEETEKEQEIRNKLEKIQSRIGTYDLSEIPPQMFCDIKYGLEKIDFENTGAKLDMQNIQGHINGSIKGCDLISYDPKVYRISCKTKYNEEWRTEEFVRDENHFYVSNIDESQISRVLDYFNEHRDDLRENDYFFLASFLTKKDVQEGYMWFIENAIEYIKNSYEFPSVWESLSEELQEKFLSIVEELIEEKGKTDINRNPILERILNKTHINIIKKLERSLEQLYTQEDEKFDFKNYSRYIWRILPAQYQNENLFAILEKNDGNIYDLKELFHKSALEVQKEQFANVFEMLTAKNGNSEPRPDLEKIYNFLMLEDPYGNKYCTFKRIIGEKEALKIFDALKERQDDRFTLKTFWQTFDEETQKKFLTDILLNQNGNSEYKKIWNLTDFEVKKDLYFEVLEKIDKDNIDLETYFKGKAYIDLLNDYEKEDISKKYEIMQKDPQRYIHAIYYSMSMQIPENIDEIIKLYGEAELNALDTALKGAMLNSANINQLIEGIPQIGSKLILDILKSNSDMIRQYSERLISKLASLPEQERDTYYQKVENVFAQNLPDFIKLYKYYQLDTFDKHHIGVQSSALPPTMQNASSKRMQDRIIFSDLFRISMDSNNKSLRDFIGELKDGNEIYIKYVNGGENIELLSQQEQLQMQRYLKSIYLLYELTDSNLLDEKNNKKIVYTGDIKTDAQNISRKYSIDGKIKNLPDQILRSIIGPFQEMYEGIDTISEIEEYMDRKINESNEYHKELAKQTPILLEEGDLVEGVRSGFNVFPSIITNGILAGDFLGAQATKDATPLAADFGSITESNNGTSFDKQIGNTAANSYSSTLYLVVKKRNKMEYIDDNSEYQNTMAQRIEKYSSKEEIKRRVSARARKDYSERKYEVYDGAYASDHRLIRTGVGVSDIDYIVVDRYDKRYGYELAMNGTYIPVVDRDTGKIVFTPDDYKAIRDKMQGLNYYDAGEFAVDESAYTQEASQLTAELFNDNSDEPSNMREARTKRVAIEEVVKKALSEDEIGLDLRTELSRDMSSGFVELIDTGSTGRGTNMPGGGDFDFTLKLDKEIIDNPKKLKVFKNALRKAFADRGKESDETNAGDFRYKKVAIEGLESPVDLDVTFMPKSEHVRYSTDMCIAERLNGLKKSNPEGYRYTIANIVLAKQKLKENGLYKKTGSDGATELGGLGGSGVENWILQNGGSLIKAIDTFLEAANESENFEEFAEKYPIFDFGENHRIGRYPHDSFIRGMNGGYFKEIKEKLLKIREELTLLNEPKISEGFIDGIQEIAQAQNRTQIDSTIDDIRNGAANINRTQQPIGKDGKPTDLRGE